MRKVIALRVALGASAYAALRFLFGGLYEYPWQLPGVIARVASAVAITLAQYVSRGCTPRFPEWTLHFELTRAVLRCIIQRYSPRILLPRNAQFMRRQTDWAGTLLGWLACREHGTETQRLYFNGLEHLWVRRAGTGRGSIASRRHRVVVLYYHGGGYAVLSPRLYVAFASALQRRIDARLRAALPPHAKAQVDVEILLANYRKMPEHPYPIPPEDALAVFKYVVDTEQVPPSQIILAGDSAGAGLAMTTMLRVRDSRPALLPLAGILTCPFVDLSFHGDERDVPHCIVADGAITSIRRGYVPHGGNPATWGDASPVHCDLHGLPPVYIVAAEFDYVLPQAYGLLHKAQADGATDWHLHVFANMPHVFMNMPESILPTAGRALDAIAEFAATRFAPVLTAKQELDKHHRELAHAG